MRVDEKPLRHESERILPFPASPQSVAITNDGQLGFVALANGNVVMLDIPGRQTITTLHVGGQPRFVITGLYPSAVSYTPQQSFLFILLGNLVHYGAALVVVLVALVAVIYNQRRLRRIERTRS